MGQVNYPVLPAIEESVQKVGLDGNGSSGMSVLLLLGRVNDLISPWWSTQRDAELRSFWKKIDPLSGAIYTLITKMITVPVTVVARDMSIRKHVEIAEQYTDLLRYGSQFGAGWQTFFSKFLEDYVGQDNGAFAEVIGFGPKDGAIEGGAISIAHLDASRCQRTGNPEFPVVYYDEDSKPHKMHYTRVIFESQMPSAISRMHDVGFCAVSRAINAAQNLLDMSVYKQEKLGSRPKRQFIITQGGLDPQDLQTAIAMADTSMNAQGLSRFSKSIALGDRNLPEADMKSIDLSSIPDGFDERTSTVLGMAVISLALGMDARELFPSVEPGATKADAIIMHMKQRGKSPGQIIDMAETFLDQKFLPPFLQAVFDYQDDAQDRQAAEIYSVRAQSRERNLRNGSTTIRVERQIMQNMGEISHEQFEELELSDGRLPDGVSVRLLFHTDDLEIRNMLGTDENADFEDRKIAIMETISRSNDSRLITKARRALAAIELVEKEKEEEENKLLMQQQSMANSPAGGNPKEPDTSYQQEKFGRKLPRQLEFPLSDPKATTEEE